MTQPQGAGNRRTRVLVWSAFVVWAALLLVLTLRPLLARDPARNNIYLKVFAPAAEAFAGQQDLYREDSGFRYPPLCAAALVPLTWLGDRWGSVLWRWLNLGVLLTGVLATFRAGLPVRLGPGERAAFLLLLAPSAVTSLNDGQTNGLLLGLLLHGVVAAMRGRGPAAGATLAGGTVIKVYPLALGLLLGVLQPRRVLPWLALALVVLFGLPFLLQEPGWVWGQHRALVELLAAEDRTQDLANAYRDLRLVTAAMGMPMGDGPFRALGGLAGLGIAVLCWSGRRRGWSMPFTHQLAFSLTMCWFMLLGPSTEKATYILLGPTLAWGLLAAMRARSAGGIAPWTTANALVLVAHAVSQTPRSWQAEWPLLRTPLPWAALLATAALLAQAARGDPAARTTITRAAP